MRVSEAMTRHVKICTPGQTIREAAKTMAEIDAGAMDNHRDVVAETVAGISAPGGPHRQAPKQ